MADKFISHDLLAKDGGLFIDDTSDHAGNFKAIQGVSSANLDVSSCVSNIEELADFTIPDGAVVYGSWTQVSLNSGTCIAYYK